MSSRIVLKATDPPKRIILANPALQEKATKEQVLVAIILSS
jgi:hypothetical protein